MGSVVDDVDTEFAEALAKAQSYFIAAEKEKAANIATTQGEDSIPTERDGDLNVKLETEALEKSEDTGDGNSPSSETRTDHEDLLTSTSGYDEFSSQSSRINPIVETASLMKAQMAPAFEC